ncbi:MAG: GH3 auxin-responsive promoter family protein [Candidatus Omnitrophica bacterium]|nr:GH3 auxin-responsive promoter family protein [Candidatus Omnitrophota bacterium]
MNQSLAFFAKWMMSVEAPLNFKRIQKLCVFPTEVQQNLLFHMIQKNRETRFGKDFGFKYIQSVRDYQNNVPVTSYNDLKPYIDRAFQGEPGQLTVEPPEFYAMTSGTTGSPKFIPVTHESDRMKAELMRVWTSKLAMDHPDVSSGVVLAIVSPAVECYTPAGVPCGSESGHAYQKMPGIIKNFYSCPYELFEVEDYETKYYLMLRVAVTQNVKVIYTCNPSTVFLLGKYLSEFSEEVIRDVRDGTICARHKIPYHLALGLKPYIQADPERAKFLEASLKHSGGRLLAKHVWPALEVISCWKGGSVSLYLPKFSRFFSDTVPVRDIGYFSSEFRGSIPISDDGSSGILATPANFYEFFPAEEHRKPEPGELLTLDELEAGKRYFIYVTTLAGLYRYDMNDIIEVTGFYENTPLIRFIQKGKGMVSLTGEKLCESQVTEAVGHAFSGFQEGYEFIAAVGELKDDFPRYAFLIEFEKPVETGCVRELAEKIDRRLGELNIEYAAKRKSKRIRPVAIRIVAYGEYNRFRQQAAKIRNNDGQFKTIRLTSDESFAQNFKIQTEISQAA